MRHAGWVPVLALLAAIAVPRPAAAADIAWRTWDEGLAESATSGKPVMVDVYTDWCGWCKRMDKDVFARADVRDYLARHFVAVRLNAEASEPASWQGKTFTSRSLAQNFRISGYPTTVFLKSPTEHLVNVPGYVPADRFLLMLRFIGEDYLARGVKWSDFEKANSAPTAR